jgi:hypothetical protein
MRHPDGVYLSLGFNLIKIIGRQKEGSMDKKRATPGDPQATIRADVWRTRAVADDVTRGYHDTSSKQSAGTSLRQRVSIRKPMPCNLLVKIGSSYVIARKIHDISLVGTFV